MDRSVDASLCPLFRAGTGWWLGKGGAAVGVLGGVRWCWGGK